MTRTAQAAFLAAALATGAAGAQDILFFEQSDFNGRRFGASSSVSNMSDQGFNDHAQSIVVRSGTWQICTDSFFRGRCVTLNPGEYRNLSQIGLSSQISSAREMTGSGGGLGRRSRSTRTSISAAERSASTAR
ncbi:MAG: beta/gamma crystallin-related protein [Betaproteobacteria bacterium]